MKQEEEDHKSSSDEEVDGFQMISSISFKEDESPKEKAKNKCNLKHECGMKVLEMKEGVSSTTFTLIFEDQSESKSTMLDLTEFVKEHTLCDQPISFTYDMEKIDSETEKAFLCDIFISSFVKLEEIKKVFVHRETKRISKIKKIEGVNLEE